MKLKLVRKKDIPQLQKATVFVRGSDIDKERMLEVFSLQNKTLHVMEWEVFHGEEKEDGTLLVLGLGRSSRASLAKLKGKAHYVSNALYYKIGKARIGDDEANDNSEVKVPSNKEEGTEEKRFFVFAFAAIAAASAASINSEYLPPVVDNSLITQEYIAPEVNAEVAPIAEDGYRYKVVRKLKFRQRRDVSELMNNEYLPPSTETAAATEETVAVEEPAVEAAQDSAVLADDGYRYKTVRRIRYRRRRDVNELPTNEYLPSVAATEQEVAVEAPVEFPVEAASQESAVLADDGYRYKTVRRIRYRRRRDVNELPTNKYLLPVDAIEQEVAVEAPVEAASQETAVLADDGYRYKTVRRIRYRRRRDVNELPTNEYLPSVAATEQEVAVEAPVEAASQESAVLADDGYRYKTVRRIRYRRRRDVNELPTNEYLSPVAATEQEVAVEVPVEAASQETAVLADDGYRYKTVRRIRYRRRRDVNELPSNEYLPPSESQTEEVISVVSVPEQTAVFGDDGYRYKTVRKLKHRRH
ncbi:uncharacterized protein LOC133335742 [Musca vetustissima]|uniref:uncharacterized protein LOC133335742 n=1 Tax=Musca vetustissima TaxID=27455 RepID=UPI002AB64936|nr:uncharacterized protein LOC133335742 [Musca vetustissima]